MGEVLLLLCTDNEKMHKAQNVHYGSRFILRYCSVIKPINVFVAVHKKLQYATV